MILVAGGTGRLGSLVVRRLVDAGLPVRVLTRDVGMAGHLAGLGVDLVVGDLRRPDSLVAAVDGVAVVVSAAHGFVGTGRVSPKSVDRDGNAHLVDAAREVGADVVLMSVVGAAADSPMELFRMKDAAEQHLRGSGVAFTIVRATAFCELWIELLDRTAGRSGRPLVFGRGENPVNFVCVRDVAALVERAVTDTMMRGATLEIGGPADITLNDLALAVQGVRDRAGEPRHVPRSVLRVLANTVGRINPQVGRQTGSALVMDRADLRFDARGARRAFPDLPVTSIETCLTDHVAADAMT